MHNAPLLTGQIVSQQAPIFIRMHLDRVLFMQSTASYQDVNVIGSFSKHSRIFLRPCPHVKVSSPFMFWTY